MNVATEVVGDEKAALNIEEMIARAKDARPATRKVRELMIEANRKQFESEGSALGSPWAPLAESTKERKAKEGIDPRPLHGKTGALEASLMGGKGKRTGATKSIARAGTGVWYSVFTHGTKKGEPPRKLVGVAPGEYDEILQIVGNYVVHGIVP